jgi:hypothetical protein
MNPREFLDTAKRLLSGAPTDVDVRRAVSTAYYAMFHCICGHFSSIVVRSSSLTFTRAWKQSYRYPDHGPMRQRSVEARSGSLGFPKAITDFADTFAEMYLRRTNADYDPTALFAVVDARIWLATVEQAIADFDASPSEHQRAFVLFICLRPKSR